MFQSVLPKKEFLILLNIHITNWGEPSFPSISVASTCRTWKITWIEFLSDLPEKWVHNRFLAGEYLTLMTLLVILPLVLTLSPLFLSLPMVSERAHFLPFSAHICKYISLLHLLPDDWEFPRQSWVTFLKSMGCFLEIKYVKWKLLNPKYCRAVSKLVWARQPTSPEGDTLRDISHCIYIKICLSSLWNFLEKKKVSLFLS